MAEPSINYVPGVADFRILRVSVDDTSIESAVITTVGGVDYADFDALADACNKDLIDETYGGVQGIRPDSSGKFRGYPKPTVSMNYAVEATGGFPAASIDRFVCTPTLNNQLGFDFRIEISVEETPGGDDLGTTVSRYWFEWLAGESGTTARRSQAPDAPTYQNPPDLGGGKYQINTQVPVLGTDIDCYSSYYGATSPNYFPATYNGYLQYIAGGGIENYNIENYDGSACGNPGEGTFINIYSTDAGDEVALNSELWQDVGLSTPIPNGWYIFWQEGEQLYNFGYTTSGVVTSFQACSP